VGRCNKVRLFLGSSYCTNARTFAQSVSNDVDVDAVEVGIVYRIIFDFYGVTLSTTLYVASFYALQLTVSMR